MHTILWIKLLSVAHTHGLRQAQPVMQDAIQKMGRGAASLHSGIALCALAGAAGLILPGILEASVWIISVTGIFLSWMLLSSIFFHIRSREQPKVFVSLILFACAAFITYGRWSFTP